MKRFWTEARAECSADTWSVVLDGKPMRLPGGAPLRIPTATLAHAIAAEWAVAGGEPGGVMSYADVPLTRIAGTAQERVVPLAESVALELARYGESDLLCYRAVEPAELVAAEAAAWDVWLDWAAATYGARLLVGRGVVHVPQPPEALAALAAAVARCDVATLAGLGIVVPALGSLVLGLAVAAEAVTPEDAHATSVLDELYQAALWGEDEAAADARAAVARDVADAARFIRLARAT